MASMKSDCPVVSEPGVRDIVLAFIRRRLKRNRYHNLLRPALSRLETPINYDNHAIIDAILTFEEKKLDYCDRSDIEAAAWTNDDRIIPNTADGVEHYKQTMNRLFDKVDWSRVVLLLVTTGVLAQNALEHENTRRIVDLVDWCVCYIREKNIDAWVEAKGGWNILVREVSGVEPCQLAAQPANDCCDDSFVNIGTVLGTIANIMDCASMPAPEVQKPEKCDDSVQESVNSSPKSQQPVVQQQASKPQQSHQVVITQQPSRQQATKSQPSNVQVMTQQPSKQPITTQPSKSRPATPDPGAAPILFVQSPSFSNAAQNPSTSTVKPVNQVASKSGAVGVKADPSRKVASPAEVKPVEDANGDICWNIKITSNID